MDITIKPYSKKYFKQCAELQKYLWKENKVNREIRFEWAYNNNPNNTIPLSVIAVNENDEVMGFRGYFLNSFKINNQEFLIAQLSDTVVSEKARRLGIFQNMTNYSLEYLKKNNVAFIVNLSPSWAPYYGYKKIDFADLASFHSVYRFSLINILKERVFKIQRNDLYNIEFERSFNDNTYIISNEANETILSQVEILKKQDLLCSSLNLANIKWRTKRPSSNYIYAYVLNKEEELLSFMMIKSKDFYNYDFGLILTKEMESLKKIMQLFRKTYKPAAVAAWDFALSGEEKLQLKKLGMYSIPFINKIRKNPPAMIRTLHKNEDGSLNWIVNGVDIRDVNNWSISKIDLDSF